MNKKGFTLIEILISVSLCFILTIIGFTTYNKCIEKYNEREYKRVSNEFETAALIYFDNSSDRKKLYNKDINYYNVSLKELLNNNLIDKDMVNPKNNEEFDYENDIVKIYYNENDEIVTKFLDF